MSPSQDPLDPDNATALATPALAVHLMTYIATLSRQSPFVGRRAFIRGQRKSRWGENTTYVNGRVTQAASPRVDRETYSHAMSRAFDWLYTEGLITRHWDPGPNWKDDELYTATDEGRRFYEHGESALNAHRAEKLLGFRLHETIDRRVRQQFLIGETEAAVMIAMKEVEIRMRDAAELPNTLVAVKLAQAAFSSDNGPLTDDTAEPGERVATMSLFHGAMGFFRNPVSHRRVDYADPLEAVEVILFADLLLRMIDRAAAANA